WKNVYIVIYSLAVFAGAFAASDIIWQWADFSIGVMTVINVCVICLMSREVKRETADYFRR
ncbi:MAG: alanine:cation symporter family protein, partial [Eubacteriales bacterium]